MEKFVDYILLGKKIKEARKNVQLTQTQLAFLLQTDIGYLLSGATTSKQYLIREFHSLLGDRTPEELNLAYRVLNELFK